MALGSPPGRTSLLGARLRSAEPSGRRSPYGFFTAIHDVRAAVASHLDGGLGVADLILMVSGKHRLVLAIAAALVVGGWGATRYAGEQQQMLPAGNERLQAWQGDSRRARKHHLPPSRVIYAVGGLAMAIGALTLGYSLVRH